MAAVRNNETDHFCGTSKPILLLMVPSFVKYFINQNMKTKHMILHLKKNLPKLQYLHFDRS